MFGAIGELGVLSVGVHSDKPFLRLGSRLVSSEALNVIAKKTLPSDLVLVEEDFTVPYEDSEKTYNGIRITLPKDISKVADLYSGEFELLSLLLKDTTFAKAFDAVPFASKRMFEKVTGTKKLLNALRAGSSTSHVIESWKQDAASFRIHRKKYLLYQ